MYYFESTYFTLACLFLICIKIIFFLFAGKLVVGWGSEFKVDWFWSLCKTEGKHIHMPSCNTEEDCES